MQRLATWCVLTALLAGWGAGQQAFSQTKLNPKKSAPIRKGDPSDSKTSKIAEDANTKTDAAKGAYALYGEETVICMERFHKVLDEKIGDADKIWRTALSKGKTAQEEWQAIANALWEDLELYGRCAVDAAKDARKEKKSRATEADVARLRNQVDKTLKLVDHVFRKKGVEVATFRDTAQRAADTMLGFKSSMPIIITRLVADLAYASDCATGIYNDLKSGQEMTETELDMDVRSLEVARRSVQAVKTVGLLRRATLTVTLKTVSPETILAACQKAAEGWVPADLASDTLLTPDQLEDVQAWPAWIEKAFGKGYAPVYEEGRKAVAPFQEATFHQVSLFKNTSLGDLDKALDPFLNQAKAALEARKAMEASMKDAEQAEKQADDELKNTAAVSRKVGDALRTVADKLKNIQIQNLYEADRRRYQELGEKFAKLQVRHQKLEEDIKAKEAQLKNASVKTFAKSKTKTDLATARRQAIAIHSLRLPLNKLKKEYEEVGADLEETYEEIATLRTQMRGE